MPMLEARTALWTGEADCAAAARVLAGKAALGNATVELHGTLGAGKTTFARHLLRALGVTGPVKSPTYAVMEPYSLPGLDLPELLVWHFDFYRFDDPQEFEDAGFREVFASVGLKLVEWPERAAGLLPPCDLRIEIAMLDELSTDGDADDTRRRVAFQAGTPRGLALLP